MEMYLEQIWPSAFCLAGVSGRLSRHGLVGTLVGAQLLPTCRQLAICYPSLLKAFLEAQSQGSDTKLQLPPSPGGFFFVFI